jgi:hypothetical protein
MAIITMPFIADTPRKAWPFLIRRLIAESTGLVLAVSLSFPEMI